MEKGIIEIVNRQVLDGNENDEMKLFTVGEFEHTPKKTILKYYENMGHREKETEAVITFTEDMTVLLRKGSYGSMMIFQEGRQCRAKYHTPYGSLDLKVMTLKIDKDFSDHEGVAEIKYFLYMDKTPQIRNCITIKYKKDPIDENK